MPSEQIEFSDRLKTWRDRVGLRQPEAAKLLKIGRTYYSRLESGKKKPGRFLEEKFELIEREPISMLREELARQAAPGSNNRVTEEPRPYGTRPANQLRAVRVVGWAQAMDAVSLIDFGDVVHWENFVPSDIRDPKAIAVIIRGDSMEPTYKEGDIAILACSCEPRSGNLIVGRLKREGAVFKLFQILKVGPPACYRLESFNQHYAPIERTADDFLWIYPVHSVLKKLM